MYPVLHCYNNISANPDYQGHLVTGARAAVAVEVDVCSGTGVDGSVTHLSAKKKVYVVLTSTHF